MKKILALFLVPFIANASVTLFDDGVQVGQFSKIQCGTNFTCANVAGKGKISLTTQPIGVMQNIVTASGDLTTAECGSTVTSTLQRANYVLPDISADSALGCRFTFVVMKSATGAGQGIFVDVATLGEKILNVTNALGDSISSDVAGTSITLEAISSSSTDGYLWAPVGYYGVWSDSN